MTLDDRLPGIGHMRERARRRMPRVAWEYLDSGTGEGAGVHRNREAFQRVRLTPRFFVDALSPDLRTELFGRTWEAPFGVAPVGIQSLMWPGAELALARAARRAGLPYTLSTMTGEALEKVAEAAGESFWFQLYVPRSEEILDDLLDRAEAGGAEVLAVTLDVPTGSRRERQRAAGLGMPPPITPRLIWDVAMRPAWAFATLDRGIPSLATMTKYVSKRELSRFSEFVNREMNVAVTPEVLGRLRERWKGRLLVKGVVHPDDAKAALDMGCDGIWASNHGARQLDSIAGGIETLPAIVEAVGGRAPVIYDSGVQDGHDVARALALGADFVMLGRSFVYGVAAAGRPGAAHVMKVLRAELSNVMTQLGCNRIDELKDRLA
ncbi:MAG TPA: alpha-hydroxy acid oxidase [Paracoccaceae bacterium]|nr:alpha-hydroxy acid oxidase [Paracoccaceae bacterium]